MQLPFDSMISAWQKNTILLHITFTIFVFRLTLSRKCDFECPKTDPFSQSFCRCDVLCCLYGDCCPGAGGAHCSSPFSAGEGLECHQKRILIGRCPEASQMTCDCRNGDWPVVDGQGLVFCNQNCARCHDVEDFQFLNASTSVVVNNYSGVETKPEDILQRELSKCKTLNSESLIEKILRCSSSLKLSFQFTFRKCDTMTVGRCPDSVTSNQLQRRNCERSSVTKIVATPANVKFRNNACAKCNNFPNASCQYVRHLDAGNDELFPSVVYPKLPTLNILFNLNQHKVYVEEQEIFLGHEKPGKYFNESDNNNGTLLGNGRGGKLSAESVWAGWITTALLIVSNISLLLMLLCYLTIKSLQTFAGRNLALLAAFLLIAQTAFLISAWLGQWPVSCWYMAVMTHVTYLWYFFWSAATSIILCRTLWTSLSSRNFSIWPSLIVSISIPVAIVLTCIVLDKTKAAFRPDYAASSSFCWITNRDALAVFFVGPVFLVVITNCFLYAALAVRLQRLARSAEHLSSTVASSRRQRGVLFRLSILMGLTWSLALLSSFLAHIQAIVYIFNLLNACQGIFLAINFFFSSSFRLVVKNFPSSMQSKTKSTVVSGSSGAKSERNAQQ